MPWLLTSGLLTRSAARQLSDDTKPVWVDGSVTIQDLASLFLEAAGQARAASIRVSDPSRLLSLALNLSCTSPLHPCIAYGEQSRTHTNDNDPCSCSCAAQIRILSSSASYLQCRIRSGSAARMIGHCVQNTVRPHARGQNLAPCYACRPR